MKETLQTGRDHCRQEEHVEPRHGKVKEDEYTQEETCEKPMFKGRITSLCIFTSKPRTSLWRQ